jgi:cephalosporin-C deacetylase-like acetyl esterase
MLKKLFLFAFIWLGLAQLLLAQDDVASIMEAFRSAEPQYEVTESIVEFQNEGQTIVGTLAVPDGVEDPLPIVLLFHGFSGQRQELPILNTEEAMFSRTARIFAEQGYASLRIDFRGSGESDGEWEDTTFSGQISDAIAALDYAAGLENIDPERIAVLGLSQGGLVASATASRDDRVKSVVLWSAVANPPLTFSLVVGSDTVQAGLEAGDEAVDFTLPWGASSSLKGPFFEDLYHVDPVAEISRYEGPLMAIIGLNDTVVTPMPQAGQIYLAYHPGENEMLVELDADHVFDILTEGPDDVDDAIAWSLAWLSTTL